MLKSGTEYHFGDKIRQVRERKGITLKQAAEKAGVSESLVSQIERNKVSPSVDTLLNLAHVLGIDFDFLFSDYRQKRNVDLVKHNEQRRLEAGGVIYNQLSMLHGTDSGHSLEALHMEIAPGSEKGSSDYGHPGRELGYILQGTGVLLYGAEVYKLEKGDSISFSSDIPHILRNTGKNILKAIWVITPPRMLFFGE